MTWVEQAMINRVTDSQLREEALSMIDQQRVIELMISYNYDPNDTSGGDLNTYWNCVFNNKYGLMMNPLTDLHNLFKGFDSHWHSGQFNQAKVTYFGSSSPSSVKAIGSDVNYYFQGVLFRIFGFSKSTGLDWARTWKMVTRHGTVTPAIEFFFSKGWSELPSFWTQALFNYRAKLQMQERAKIRQEYRKSKHG